MQGGDIMVGVQGMGIVILGRGDSNELLCREGIRSSRGRGRSRGIEEKEIRVRGRRRRSVGELDIGWVP